MDDLLEKVDYVSCLPEGWRIKRTKYEFTIINGSTPDTNYSEYWDGDINWIGPADMQEFGEIKEGKSTITLAGYNSCSTILLPEGSIVISTRAPIGKINISVGELCTNQGCKSLVRKYKNNRYFYYHFYMIKEKLISLGRGTTFKELSTTDLKNVYILIPPDDEQEKISLFLDATYLSRLQVTVNDLEAIYQRLFSADVLSSKMFDDYKNQIFAEISKVGQEIERDKNSGDATLIAKADKNISNIYSYIRMYVMLMEDSDERANIIGTDYETAYSCLERMKNFISSLVRPTGRKREAIVKDVGQFVTGQKVDAHDADKTLTAHGLISQGYRDYNVGPKDDKEKLSILIKEMNGIDEDSVSKIVDLLSKRRQLRNIANNTTNSKHDFSVQFQDFFLRELDDLDYNDEIDNDKYNELYHNWEQISDLVYDKIKNTKG